MKFNSILSINLAYFFCRVVDDEGTTNGAVDELGSIAPSGWPRVVDSASFIVDDVGFVLCWGSSRRVLALLLRVEDGIELLESDLGWLEVGVTLAVGLAWWFLSLDWVLLAEVGSCRLAVDEVFCVGPVESGPDEVKVPPSLAAAAWSSDVGVLNLISLLTDPSPPITVRVIWTVPPLPVENVVVWVLTPLPAIQNIIQEFIIILEYIFPVLYNG